MSRPQLRVLILTMHYGPESTGNAPYATALARGLTARGLDVRVITTHPHYPASKFSEGYGQWTADEVLDGVHVKRLRHYLPSRQSSVRRLLSETSFGLRSAFTRWGEQDVILMLSPALFATAIAVIRTRLSARKPSIAIWVQDLYSLGVTETETGNGLVARIMKIVESATLRAASGVVVIHSRFSRYVTELLGVEPGRVHVVRNWTHLVTASAPDVPRVRERHGWSAGETVVLHAGNMGTKQGLGNVVDAARLADEQELPLRFVLLGNGSRRAHLEKEGEGIGRLQFIDSLDDDQFQATLASADILLVNEKLGVSEMAVPSKLTSYFSTGLPVLAATDVQGVTASEVFSANAGVIVDAGDPQSLVEAALALGADPEKSRSYGEHGLRYRETVLGEEAAIDRYAELLTSLADKRGRAAGTPSA